MDVVKKNIQALGGSVELASRDGAGTRVTIRLPLTLAILDGMSVAVGDDIYILPLSGVVESLQPLPEQIRRVRSEEHTSELQSLMRISYAVFCLTKKNSTENIYTTTK